MKCCKDSLHPVGTKPKEAQVYVENVNLNSSLEQNSLKDSKDKNQKIDVQSSIIKE